jgi:adenylyl cyclase-associated protein
MEQAILALTSRIDKLVTRLEGVERQLSQGPPAGAAAAPAAAAATGEISPAQREFDELVAKHIKPLLPVSKEMSPALFSQLEIFVSACEEESRIIAAAAVSKKPSPDQLPKILETLSKKLGLVSEFKDKNARDKAFNNIAAVAEGVGALGWVAVEPTPAPFMNDIIPGSEFYSNRILVAFKGKDETQVSWAKEFNGFLKNLQAYVKRMHTTGLTYNPRGGDMLAAISSAPAAAAPAPKAGGPPPPPPPPPPADLGAAAAKPDTGALFSELSKGTDVSKGLKHVSAEMKTKNRPPEERGKGLEPKEKAPAPAAAETKATTKAAAPAKPPRQELVGTKWSIENQVNTQITIPEEKVEKNQSFYIGGCKGATIVIKGKFNSIIIDNCTKTGVVVDNIMAVIEMVNCNSCQLQVTGKAPSINIDKCNGAQVYLSATCLDTAIYTSKCSAVNVLIPGKTPDSDLVELPIPEQYKSLVRGDKLVTEIASIGGF